jgi:hypothetical protein
MSPFGRRGCFVCGIAARRNLLDVFEPEQQLIFRQPLGAAAKAMALQFLDDLLQSLGTCALGQQHRLERTGIVGKRVGHDRHAAIRSWTAMRRERSDKSDSLCRRSTRAGQLAQVNSRRSTRAGQLGCAGAAVSRAA